MRPHQVSSSGVRKRATKQTEIEHRFLIDAWRLPILSNPIHMVQGSLAHTKALTVRVRVTNGLEGMLTLKLKDKGVSEEFEYPIYIEEAKDLVSRTKEAYIEKNRYKVDFAGYVWEVEEYLNPNLRGLWLAEVEIDAVGDQFAKPSWVVKEITGDPKYSLSSLSLHGKP
jgi:adenylate cyclase